MLLYQKPRYQNEAIIQAKLYMACKKAGLGCDLQFAILKDQTGWDIPDLIVIEHDQIIAMVEVKDYSSFNNLTSTSKEQIKRYRSHGVPVFILYSIYDIPYLVKKLLKIKVKFLESIDSSKAKCFEADKQNKEKWNKKIVTAFDRFDKTFPDYKFSSNRSLEILATGVRVLGLPDILKLIDESSEDSAEDFFYALDISLTRNKNELRNEEDRHMTGQLYGFYDTVNTATGYHNRQNKIAEKLN